VDQEEGPDRSELDSLAAREAGGAAPGADAVPACLRGRSADEVLEKLDRGDPLGIERRARRAIEQRAVLLDVERVVARGMAQVAFAARLYKGWPPVELWTERAVEGAIEALLDEDRESMALSKSPQVEDRPNFAFLCDALGITPERALQVTVVFNDLPTVVRRCYYDTFVLGRSIEDCAASGIGTRAEVESHLLRALTAMSLLRDPGRSADGGTS
jgi:hypothetical protein